MCPNPQETVDFVTFTKEILNGTLHFLCSVITQYYIPCLGLSNRKTSFTSKLNVSHTAYGRKVQNRHLISTKRTKKIFLTD